LDQGFSPKTTFETCGSGVRSDYFDLLLLFWGNCSPGNATSLHEGFLVLDEHQDYQIHGIVLDCRGSTSTNLLFVVGSDTRLQLYFHRGLAARETAAKTWRCDGCSRSERAASSDILERSYSYRIICSMGVLCPPLLTTELRLLRACWE